MQMDSAHVQQAELTFWVQADNLEYAYNIEKMYGQYITVMKDFLLDKKIYVCISILGCKGVTSETDDFNMHNKIIDRNTILCSPIVTANIENEAENTLLANKLYIEFLLSLGIKRDKSLDNTIREVYHV